MPVQKSLETYWMHHVIWKQLIGVKYLYPILIILKQIYLTQRWDPNPDQNELVSNSNEGTTPYSSEMESHYKFKFQQRFFFFRKAWTLSDTSKKCNITEMSQSLGVSEYSGKPLSYIYFTSWDSNRKKSLGVWRNDYCLRKYTQQAECKSWTMLFHFVLMPLGKAWIHFINSRIDWVLLFCYGN